MDGLITHGENDPLGSLPMELIVGIVSCFTDPVDIVRLRRVSKRWMELFSSPEIYHAVFRNYGEIPRGFLNANGEATSGTDPTSLLKRLKRNHAAHTGRPYSRALYPFTESEFEFSTEVTPYIPSVAYSHRRIAWVEPTCESVYVLCLVSGKRSLLLQDLETEDMEEFSRVTLSESMVVGVTIDYFVAWMLDTTESARFSMPTDMDGEFEQITADGDRIAITTDIGCVLVWDFRTKVARTIDLSNLLLVSLHPGEDRLTAAIAQYPSVDNPTGPPRRFGWDDSLDSVKFTVLEFSGETIQYAQHEYEARLPLEISNPDDYLPWIESPPIRSANPLVLQVKYIVSAPLRQIQEGHYSVSLDPTTRTTSSTISIERGFNPYGPRLVYSSGLRYTLVDPASPSFVVDPPTKLSSGNLVDSDSFTRASEITSIEQSDPQMSNWWSSLGPFEKVVDIFGDEQILGVISPRGVLVWSFEEDLELAEETPEYRRLRKQRAQERASGRAAS